MTPLEVAVSVYGSANKLAKALNVSRQLIWRWAQPIDYGSGCYAGDIPQKYWKPLIDHATANRFPLTMYDLVYGRP